MAFDHSEVMSICPVTPMKKGEGGHPVQEEEGEQRVDLSEASKLKRDIQLTLAQRGKVFHRQGGGGGGVGGGGGGGGGVPHYIAMEMGRERRGACSSWVGAFNQQGARDSMGLPRIWELLER